MNRLASRRVSMALCRRCECEAQKATAKVREHLDRLTT